MKIMFTVPFITFFVLFSVATNAYRTNEELIPAKEATETKSTTSNQPPLTSEQIADKLLNATVTIVAYDASGREIGIGSGFFTGPNRIVTNYHVVENAKSLRYRVRGSSSLAEIRSITHVNRTNDLALLESRGTSRHILTLSSLPARVGQVIFVAGAPQGLDWTFSNGVVSAIRVDSEVDLIQFTAPVSSGSSGGPVVNSKAELVGVTVGGFRDGQNLNFAIPAKYVRDLPSPRNAWSPSVASPVAPQPQPRTQSQPGASQSRFNCGQVLRDIDGNTYNTLRIGEQCWMAENLRTTKYQDGSTISHITGNSEWASIKTGAWANYLNQVSNDVKFGKLYNWYAASNARNICPVGWRLPTDDDWTVLTNLMSTGGAVKLKSVSGWEKSPISDGSNSSGFDVRPAGRRFHDGSFSGVGVDGNFWTSSENGANYAWYRHIFYMFVEVVRENTRKNIGFSVRCIRY